MKKYLDVTVTTHNNNTFKNPLKLGEARLISQIAQEHKSLSISIREVDSKSFKFIFG